MALHLQTEQKINYQNKFFPLEIVSTYNRNFNYLGENLKEIRARLQY